MSLKLHALNFGCCNVAHANRSYENSAHEWRLPTQLQLMRHEFVETSLSWAKSDTGRLVAITSEEGQSAIWVSGFGVG